jgi:molybdenum cofactor cytidylyltransferase
MTGTIILAAGSSSRMGRPKQTLVYKGQTLLQRAIATALTSICKPVIVVLGANEEIIKPGIEDLDAFIIQNPDWQEGMAASIRAGIIELQKIEPKIDSVILMLCDQPFTDNLLLNQLVQKKSEKGIVACAYNYTIGPPVLFSADYFDELLLLKGQEGAKKLLMKYKDDVIAVSFPLGDIDIDTMEDFEKI